MSYDEDRVRAAKAHDLDEIPSITKGGETTNIRTGTAAALRAARKLMATDESMDPEIAAARRALRHVGERIDEIDAKIDRKVREYRMRFVKYMTTDAPTEKFETEKIAPKTED